MATRITVHASPLLLQRGVRGVTGQPMEIVVHLPTSPAVSATGFARDSALPEPQLVASLPGLARAANEHPAARLLLFGHADEAGSDTLEIEQPCVPQDITAPAASRLIQLQDADGQELAKHPYQLVFEDGETLEGVSDAAGWVDVPLNVNESCQLRVGEVTYLIRLAAEVTDLEEQQSRLNALGFEAGEVSGKRTKGTDRATFRYRESIGASGSEPGDEQLLAQLRSDSQGVA